MSDVETVEKRPRPGGRSERVVGDVLRAASAELARVGYGALRIEDVAQRAGVAKTTVYRRWPTKAELVGAVLRSLRGGELDLPDTGALVGDLVALARQLLDRASTPEAVGALRVVSLEADHPELERLVKDMKEELRARFRVVIRRGVARGELPARADVELVIDTVVSSVSTRFLRQRFPLDYRYVQRLVELVVAGARATAPAAGRSGRRKVT
ncbi:MAG TPA: TetR/AcrR family transcriptional regulator [Minicystis sp.]|nr:TetR/AcrR family transcriptional regulator [Minicystis sp.]